MATATVARWESRSGKHWVDLERFDGGGYGYSAPGAGGVIGAVPESEAVSYVQRLVDLGGYFQPDANTTPMRRVR